MDPLALATRLAAVPGRRAGSDAERRAALELAEALRATSRRRRRSTDVQTLWVRPHRAAAHALIAALAVAGSVVAVGQPRVGLALCVAALLLLAGDLSGRLPLLRRLTPERATQNVVSSDRREAPVRLVVTAAVDSPAPGPLGRGAAARAQARLRRRLRGHLLGPYGLLAVALLALVACGVARALGVSGVALGAVQLVPTIVVLLAAAAGLDATFTGPPGPGANADASAAAVAVALVAALDARPPRHLSVECVLAGAAGADALGLRRWIAAERRAGARPEQLAVLHVAACGSGTPVFWTRDGLVLALRMHPRLVALARGVAADRPELGLRAHESREASGARAARAAGWPAIAVGCVDDTGAVPRRGAADDTAEHLDPAALTATLQTCLALVRALDADLAPAGSPAAAVRDDDGPGDDAVWARTDADPLPPPAVPPPPATSARAARRAAAPPAG
jgi:hypothetical protein